MVQERTSPAADCPWLGSVLSILLNKFLDAAEEHLAYEEPVPVLSKDSLSEQMEERNYFGRFNLKMTVKMAL